MDVLLLSRLQFALTIMFHYIFPPLTIGLGVLLVILEGLYLKTKNPLYESATKFWIKIFALNFAMGVVTGIVMEFQFGTNWSHYSRFVGDVFGSALAAEGIFAFFLESGFLAVLVFGWDRVSPRMHFFSTIMVSLGSIFSSVWIVVANSWQQTPAGSHVVTNVVNGIEQTRAEITDFWALVFNPSTVERLVHVWIGAFILGSFFVMSITAFYILKNRHVEMSKKTFSAALLFGTLSSIAALVSGHSQAKNVYVTQPAKLAAFEGIYRTAESEAPLSLIGLPDNKTETVKANLAIPGLLSWLIHGDSSQPVIGLDAFPKEDRPPVALSFISYHLMVMLGMSFIGLTVIASILALGGKLYRQRWLLWVFVIAVIGPYAANQLGWVAAEVGRQPWIVHPPVSWGTAADGMPTVSYDARQGLRTADGVSKVVTANQVLGSTIMFGLIYLALFILWIYLLDAKIKKGPEPVAERPAARGKHGFLDTAASFADHGGDSMTDVRGRAEEHETDHKDR